MQEIQFALVKSISSFVRRLSEKIRNFKSGS